MGQLQQRGIASDTRVVDEHVNGNDVCLDLPDAVLTGLVIADIPFEHRNAGSFRKCHRPVVIATIVGRDCHRSEEHTSELQSLMRISYAIFCLKKKKANKNYN